MRMSKLRAIAPFAVQCVGSISLLLSNKTIATRFPHVWTTLCIQNTGSLVVAGCLYFAGFTSLRIPARELWLRIGLNTIWLVAVLWCSIEALRYASVPMYVVARNAVPFGTAIIDRVFMGYACSRRTVFAMAITMLGTLLYTLGDKDTKYTGYVVAFLNSALVAGMSVFENALMGSAKGIYTPIEMNFYRAFLSIPILFTFAQFEEPSHDALLAVAPLLALSCFLTSLFGTITYYLQTVATATTIQMANITYKFLTVVVSRLTHPADIAWTGWLGYAICSAGMLTYAFEQRSRLSKSSD